MTLNIQNYTPLSQALLSLGQTFGHGWLNRRWWWKATVILKSPHSIFSAAIFERLCSCNYMKRRDSKRPPVHFYVVQMEAFNLKIARLAEISNGFFSQTYQKAVPNFSNCFYRPKEQLCFKATAHLLHTVRGQCQIMDMK